MLTQFVNVDSTPANPKPKRPSPSQYEYLLRGQEIFCFPFCPDTKEASKRKLLDDIWQNQSSETQISDAYVACLLDQRQLLKNGLFWAAAWLSMDGDRGKLIPTCAHTQAHTHKCTELSLCKHQFKHGGFFLFLGGVKEVVCVFFFLACLVTFW